MIFQMCSCALHQHRKHSSRFTFHFLQEASISINSGQKVNGLGSVAVFWPRSMEAI